LRSGRGRAGVQSADRFDAREAAARGDEAQQPPPNGLIGLDRGVFEQRDDAIASVRRRSPSFARRDRRPS
jgi:hypothetical protein